MSANREKEVDNQFDMLYYKGAVSEKTKQEVTLCVERKALTRGTETLTKTQFVISL